MALTPENKFRNKVHKHRSRHIYQHKENNQFRGGIPDDYYESNGKPGILRVEYKFVAKPPKLMNLLKDTTKPALSKLQLDWLDRCHNNGHQVAVIVGTDAGGIILIDQLWKSLISREWFEQYMQTPEEIMRWIEYQVTRHAPATHKPRRNKDSSIDYPQL